MINFYNTVYILNGISSKIYQQSKTPAGVFKYVFQFKFIYQCYTNDSKKNFYVAKISVY